MGKLRQAKARVSSLEPLVGSSTFGQRARRERAPWRAWYNTKRWLRLRKAVLKRDLYLCQRTGVQLTNGRTEPNAAVVHHKIPHRGDPRLFWDESNLESVAKEWHDREGQREDALNDFGG